MTNETQDRESGASDGGFKAGRPRTKLLVVAGLAALAGVAVVGIYGITGFARNPTDAAVCTDARATAKRIAPLAHGDVAALTVASEPRPLPVLAFSDDAGQRKALSEWRGRTVLLNLWATWCVPCRKEMPSLDALQAKLGAGNFEVVTVNIDTRDANKPKNWWRDTGISRLAYYSDPSAKIFQDLKAAGKAFGMPTTLLIDPAGCEIATLAGPAEWASEDAVQLIKGALGG